MAIINQRGKSSRRNKKLPYPGHSDLPGSSPQRPAASFLLASGQGPGWASPQAQEPLQALTDPSQGPSWTRVPLVSGPQFPSRGRRKLQELSPGGETSGSFGRERTGPPGCERSARSRIGHMSWATQMYKMKGLSCSRGCDRAHCRQHPALSLWQASDF